MLTEAELKEAARQLETMPLQLASLGQSTAALVDENDPNSRVALYNSAGYAYITMPREDYEKIISTK